MKVRDRIDVIADLFLGAVYADKEFSQAERDALSGLLCELLLSPALPPELERRIASFAPERFDLDATAREFARDPPMCKRRLLELTAELCVAKGELDLDEDGYLEQLARALGMRPTEYEDMLLDYEVHELEGSA